MHFSFYKFWTLWGFLSFKRFTWQSRKNSKQLRNVSLAARQTRLVGGGSARSYVCVVCVYIVFVVVPLESNGSRKRERKWRDRKAGGETTSGVHPPWVHRFKKPLRRDGCQKNNWQYKKAVRVRRLLLLEGRESSNSRSGLPYEMPVNPDNCHVISPTITLPLPLSVFPALIWCCKNVKGVPQPAKFGKLSPGSPSGKSPTRRKPINKRHSSRKTKKRRVRSKMEIKSEMFRCFLFCFYVERSFTTVADKALTKKFCSCNGNGNALHGRRPLAIDELNTAVESLGVSDRSRSWRGEVYWYLEGVTQSRKKRLHGR